MQEHRTVMIRVMVTPAERQELQAASDRAALPVSTWMRSLALVDARKAEETPRFGRV